MLPATPDPFRPASASADTAAPPAGPPPAAGRLHGSRLGTVPVTMPGGRSTANTAAAAGRSRDRRGYRFGWPVEVGALGLLAALFIWAMTLEPVQELDLAPKARLAAPAPVPVPVAPPAPARMPRT